MKLLILLLIAYLCSGENEQFKCGISKAKKGRRLMIVNGEEAPEHSHPWAVALMRGNRQFCGGTLITDRAILTAAHCISGLSAADVPYLLVRLGDHNIKTLDRSEQTIGVKKIIKHKGFSRSTLHNDIAILELAEPAILGPTVTPICLPGEGYFETELLDIAAAKKVEDNKANDQVWVVVAGWGMDKENGNSPKELHQAKVHLVEEKRCREAYGSSAPGGIIDSMVCAHKYEINDESEVVVADTCSGDSGGALVYYSEDKDKTKRAVAFGITSWGIGCAQKQYPGVYTEVRHLVDWISKVLKFVDGGNSQGFRLENPELHYIN